MKVTHRIGAFFLLAAFACRAAEDAAPIKAGPGDNRAAPTALVEPTPHLATRAFDLTHRGRPVEAIELLLTELTQRLRAQRWDDTMLVADSLAAALHLEPLLESVCAWRAAAEQLEAAKPFPLSTPPELAAQLDLVLARGLIRADRLAEALQLTRAGGALIDWRIIGPFANERGGGIDTQYEPEKALDFAATMRGKERDVSWRSNPAPTQPIANLVLHEMMRPSEQSVAYLATAVRVDAPRDVVLALGSSGAVKVWHGATLAHTNKVHRPSHRDQDRVVLALHEGWNSILVKVGVEDRTGWAFSARLTELDGEPLRNFTHSSARAPEARRDTTASSATPKPSVRQELERIVADPVAVDQHAHAQRLLALLHLGAHPDDIAAKSAKKHAEAALALAPDDVATLYLVARANEPGPGETAEEIRHNERIAPLKRVIELDPTHAGALADLANFYRDSNPIPHLVDSYSQRALAAAPHSYRALTLRANALEDLDRDGEAHELRRASWATPEGRLRPEAIVDEAGFKLWRGDRAAERELLDSALKSGMREHAIYNALMDLHRREGDLDAFLAVAKGWLARAPQDVGAAIGAARTLEFGGQLGEARALLESAFAVCPEDARIAFAFSRLAQREGDRDEADRWLAEVIRLDPGYDKARRQRQVLAEQTQERFETPYRWDAVERISKSPSGVDANEQVEVVDRTTVWRVNPDGSEHMYEHTLLQVQNTGGVKSLDKYWIVYPSDSTLQVYNLRVVRPDGSTERAPPPRGRDQSYAGGFARPFDLPTLQVGDFVDIEYRVDQRRADVFGQYFGVRHSFYVDSPDPLAPVARAELIVLAPRDVPIYSKAHNGDALEHTVADAQSDLRSYRWAARDLKRPTPQIAMPKRIEFAPTVDVSTYESWEAFASWWWSFIEKEFVTTPAMKEKVRELTAGLTDEMDKVRAIARFVGQEIRYNAWSFGTHGYEPYSAATIFERRFGDCKDKSILLRQMLAEIGVHSHPVLINAEDRRPEEKLDIAMVGHFNHCIAYVPATDTRPGFYLDATADRNPIEYLRADDQGAKVLHVDASKSSIERIDYTAARDNALVRDYEVALDRDGRGTVSLVDRSVGRFGVQLRQWFGGEKGDINKRAADMLASAFGKVEVSSVETSKLEDIGAPASIALRFGATNLWTRDSAGSHLRLSFDSAPFLDVAPEPAAEREWEIVLDRPLEMRTRITYRLPEGAELGALPQDASIRCEGLLEYELRTRSVPGGVEVERRFTLIDRRIPRARYADFQDALREIQSTENRTIVIRTGPVEAAAKESK